MPSSASGGDTSTVKTIRVGIIVGEQSGDTLGAGLIQALKQRYENIEFEGMAGPKMQAEGMPSMFDIERLAVMGLIEPLKRLGELLRMRKTLREHFLANPPDIFIGVDSPDFTLAIERSLKEAGIKTLHYVSPSVWAWRQKRVFGIKKSVDCVLCLLPFEKQFYDRFDVSARFIGHPLVKQLAFRPVDTNLPIRQVTLMPGSRKAEINEMADVYMATAERIAKAQPSVRFVIPAANKRRMAQLQQLREHWRLQYPNAEHALTITDGDAYTAIAASEFVISTSGTTTLEVMLMGVPMLIAYRMHWLSYFIIRRMVKTQYMGLPNILANRLLVPEFEQNAVNAKDIAETALRYLGDKSLCEKTANEFLQLRSQLECDANELAADAVQELIDAN